jgi:4-amino-4-deoxy-L-arabinose transferase-like glycosyltransferase
MKKLSNFWHECELHLGKSTMYVLIVLILIRLISLGLYPLMDTTEGRYGEIARKMAETNDWITPWFDTGVPFWGKPPLSFWMSSFGIKLFGVNEFAVRIPHFFAALLIVIISYDWAKRSLINPFYVIAILSTSFLFMVSSGAVMTDMALCLGSTLSLRGFWLSLFGLENEKKREQWIFFIGLTLMLLAKGPIGWVLVLLPISLWALTTGSIKKTWQGLPWITGSILAIAAALPWYLIAEQHTPGFLNYFFVGEHWQRFTVSGWKGDMYGSAHATKHGVIWLYLIYGALPWSFMLPLTAWIYKKQIHKNNVANQCKENHFLLLAGLAPCLFFTMSGNILWTYVLPGLPPLAMYLALWLNKFDHLLIKKIIYFGSVISLLIMLGILSALTLGHRADSKSAKSIISLYKMQNSLQPIVFLNDRPFSASFYSNGKSLNIKTLQELDAIAKNKPIYIAVKKKQLSSLNNQLINFKVIGDSGSYRLFLK